MHIRRLVCTGLTILCGAGIGLFLSNCLPEGGESVGVASADAAACELEAKRPRRGVLALHMTRLESGRFKTRFELKSDNAFDSYWYMEFSDPPLKDFAGQRVFHVTPQTLAMETVESDQPGLRTGNRFRSYAYLPQSQLQALESSQPVSGRYPLASRSVITQINSDDIPGGTHKTAEGSGQAVDLLTEPGTEVLAFGSGTVVFVEDGYDDTLQCGDLHARTYSNQVVVLQDDGYEAIYGHLQMASSLVAEGARVEEGSRLARLGHYNGSRSDAHLHFQLGALTDDGLLSVPVAFVDSRQVILVPSAGLGIGP